MSSGEAYFLTLDQARIPQPRIDTMPNQMGLFIKTNQHLYPELRQPEGDDC
jgi:hypothetical protein